MDIQKTQNWYDANCQLKISLIVEFDDPRGTTFQKPNKNKKTK